MMISEIKLHPDLKIEKDGITYQWVAVPNCTFISSSNRGFQVASQHWSGTKWVPQHAIHVLSDTQDIRSNNFGTMIVLKRVIERIGIVLPSDEVVESEESEEQLELLESVETDTEEPSESA